MNNNTNIIPQIETEFLATVRDHMSDRTKAASLFTWASEAISNGAHGKDVVSLIAEFDKPRTLPCRCNSTVGQTQNKFRPGVNKCLFTVFTSGTISTCRILHT